MSDYSKNSVLTLYKILLKYTDEEHPISMQDILTYMETEGYPCSEDSILRYIKQLRTVLDVDIISGRGRNAKYFIGARLLEKEELKLIVDSINASNFIEETIAAKMVGKLKNTMSIYDAEELDRNVLGVSIAKAENRKILYNVNKLQEAMSADVQISFNNLAWNKNKKLEKKYDRKNTLNPWALIWANDSFISSCAFKFIVGLVYWFRIQKIIDANMRQFFSAFVIKLYIILLIAWRSL